MHRPPPQPVVGIVIIGRNERQRLSTTLLRLEKIRVPLVYVDSDSTDGSAEYAGSRGIPTIVLQGRVCAARGRNEGAKFLLDAFPSIALLQFLDGDCLLEESWLTTAQNALEKNPTWAAVAGIVAEEFPAETIYNRLCDLEWDRQTGAISTTTGVFLIRRTAWETAGPFDERLAAGEEVEFFSRVQATSGPLHRLPTPMALHDIRMRHFSEWFRRCMRNGFADALGARYYPAVLRRGSAVRLWKAAFWGAGLPAAAVLALGTNPLFLMGIGTLYKLHFTKSLRYQLRRGLPLHFASLYAAFTLIDKVPRFVGMLRFWLQNPATQVSLLDYHTPAAHDGEDSRSRKAS